MKTDRAVRLTTMDCSRFQRRVVRLNAGCSRPYDASEWEDALVIVSAGALELEGRTGRRWRFPRGAILWLTDLPVVAIHNPGDVALIITAVARRDEFQKPTPSQPT
jgi:hypothetical protein